MSTSINKENMLISCQCPSIIYPGTWSTYAETSINFYYNGEKNISKWTPPNNYNFNWKIYKPKRGMESGDDMVLWLIIAC